MFPKTFHVILSNAKNLAVYLVKSQRGILPIVRMTHKNRVNIYIITNFFLKKIATFAT